MTVDSERIRYMRRERVVDGNFPAARLVEHSHSYAITKSRLAFDRHTTYILNQRAFTNPVIGYVFVDMGNAAVICHLHIVERSVIDAGRTGNTTREGEGLRKNT